MACHSLGKPTQSVFLACLCSPSTESLPSRSPAQFALFSDQLIQHELGGSNEPPVLHAPSISCIPVQILIASDNSFTAKCAPGTERSPVFVNRVWEQFYDTLVEVGLVKDEGWYIMGHWNDH